LDLSVEANGLVQGEWLANLVVAVESLAADSVLVVDSGDGDDAGADERSLLLESTGDSDVVLDKGIIVDLKLNSGLSTGSWGSKSHGGEESEENSGGLHFEVGF
jgi:hypothetical protein